MGNRVFKPLLSTPHKWRQLRVERHHSLFTSCESCFVLSHSHFDPHTTLLSSTFLTFLLGLPTADLKSLMDFPNSLIFTSFLILAAAIDGAHAYAMVTGSVFCDQCKDGQRSLFDYPLSGVKVTMACANSNGQITMRREETTNWFGSYAMRFDDIPDLTGCYAQVSGSGEGSTGCSAAAGPAQSVRLMFRMFDMEMYVVDSLLSQPAQPMSFCPRSSTPVPSPPSPSTPTRPPSFRLPPLPPAPPVPFLEASACSHENWTAPEYKCHWRVVNPDMKVAVVFGPLAAEKYGTDMTVWEGLQGRGDPYRTLLREAITSLLNSYNSLLFPYHTLSVIQHVSLALMGSQQNVLLTALRFRRANSGSPNLTCKLTPCK